MARRTELEVGASGALADYYDWFKEAREGDTLVYYRGDLQFDRDPLNVIGSTDQDRTRASAINAVATRILKDAEESYLALSQKRLGENDYEYRATRRRSILETALENPRKPHGHLVPA